MKDDFLDFVLVGAPRTGTTWLATAIAEHPQIWIPPNKEIQFFNEPYLNHWEFKYDRGIEYYRGIFEESPPDMIRGELTPTYYIDLNSASRIHKHFPHTKILILLRNPAVVVHSLFLKAREHLPGSYDLEAELGNLPELMDAGYYYKHLKQYFDLFPRENIWVGIHEHFFTDLGDNVAAVYRFLGADDSYKPATQDKKINARSSVRWPTLVKIRHAFRLQINKPAMLPLKRLLTKATFLDMLDMKFSQMNLQKGKKLPGLEPELRSRMMEMFAADIAQLEELLGQDLSVWRQ